MIKMNFTNQRKDEDIHLIDLLKEQTLESASDQLTEKTIARLAAIQAEEKFIYKPVRIPLYIMMAIATLLFVPFFISMESNDQHRGPLSELLSYPIGAIMQYAVWSWLAVVTLSITLIIWRSTTLHLKPFKP